MKGYAILGRQVFSRGRFSIVPIRFEDRFDIMRWRNEQLYHLRQAKPLTVADQDHYFQDVVSSLFDAEEPRQILFSYLKDERCIGYGGLVHVNWVDRNAEISFIMDTSLEQGYFLAHWRTFLKMIETVAFEELGLHKIYTYAFDIRPHLYEAIEAVGFKKEAVLSEHCYIDGQFKDVVIHAKINARVSIRLATESDVIITHEWANDEVSRANSFSSEFIPLETHRGWWSAKIRDSSAFYFIGEVGGSPASIVRFDKKEDGRSFIIGVNLAPKYRGLGLSYQFLRAACYEFLRTNNAPIEAYIKPENIPSIKSFEKAGFRFVGETEVNGSNALVYEFIKK